MSGQPTQNQGFQPVGLWSNIFPGYYNSNQQPAGSLNPQQQLALQLQLQAQAHTAQMQHPAKSESRSGSAYASRHQAAEQRRRTRINERLDKLRELVPHAERANTAAFLETVIEYVQELQVLLKCGPAHAGGKPGVGGGAGASQGFTSVTAAGSGPYGVATPGGGFEVLPQPQQPGGGGSGGGGGGGSVSMAMAAPASNPFFASNAGGNNSVFQGTAGMLQGGGHAFFNPQPQGGAPQQGPVQGGAPAGGGTAGGAPPAVFAHHAFANPQQLAGSPAPQQGAAQPGALPHFDSNTAQAVHQMLAQHAAAQTRNSANGGSGAVPPIDQLYNLHAPPQLNMGGSGTTPQSLPLDPAAMIASLQQAQGAPQVPAPAAAAPAAARPATAAAVRPNTDSGRASSGGDGASDGSGGPEVDVTGSERKRGPDVPANGGADGEGDLMGGAPKRRRTPSRPRS